MQKNKYLTFSYDDGITQDKRLVKIFNQYGIKATITKQEKVTIPKYTGVIKFNYAKSR